MKHVENGTEQYYSLEVKLDPLHAMLLEDMAHEAGQTAEALAQSLLLALIEKKHPLDGDADHAAAQLRALGIIA